VRARLELEGSADHVEQRVLVVDHLDARVGLVGETEGRLPVDFDDDATKLVLHQRHGCCKRLLVVDGNGSTAAGSNKRHVHSSRHRRSFSAPGDVYYSTNYTATKSEEPRPLLERDEASPDAGGSVRTGQTLVSQVDERKLWVVQDDFVGFQSLRVWSHLSHGGFMLVTEDLELAFQARVLRPQPSVLGLERVDLALLGDATDANAVVTHAQPLGICDAAIPHQASLLQHGLSAMSTG